MAKNYEAETNSKELLEKDEEIRSGHQSDEEILELLRANPNLQRYVDRRVSEGIKTYIANQKKKAMEQSEKSDPNQSGAKEPAKEPQPSETEMRSTVEEEAMRIKAGKILEAELALRGLDAFSGLIDDPELLDELERAALEFARTQNLGADFVPKAGQAPRVRLSPLEQHIAKQLGISFEGYANQKNNLQTKEGIS